MKSMLRMVFVALVAVFAISAVAASSALASPEWYVKKAGKYEKVKESVNAKLSIPSWEMVATSPSKLIGQLGISCNGEGAETLKSGGQASITEINQLSCKPTKNCSQLRGGLVLNRDWPTELYTEGGKIRDRIVSGKELTPFFSWKCGTNLGKEASIHCDILTSGLITNSALGLVEDEFEKLSTIKCGESEKETNLSGEMRGVFKIEPIAKSGIEAIKVE